MEFAGIEHRDDDDRADVVDDRRRGEEDAQLDRDTRSPSITISATAKAVSVDIGTPQPCVHGPGGAIAEDRARPARPCRRSRRRPEAPPSASSTRWPTVNSRLISSPTTRKNSVSRPSLIQCSSDMPKAARRRTTKPSSCSQNAAKAGPSGELVESDGDQRREQQQHAGRRPPAREVERRRAHPMAERAQHRVGEASFRPTVRRSGGR